MVIVDTSVWIEVFKKTRPLSLESVVSLEDIVTCLPVVQEVLQGFQTEASFRLARESLLSFPIVESPMSEDVFLEAAALYRSARRSGISIRSSVDCLIAVCALRHDLTVLHRDRDFSKLTRVAPLKERAV